MSADPSSGPSGETNTPTPPRNLTGAAWMLLSGVGFTGYLILAKQVSADVHPVVLAFFRSFVGFAVLVPFLAMHGLGYMATKKPRLLITRSLFGTVGFLLSLMAVSDFFELPLSQFNALSFTRPLFVTILAALVLGEVVGSRRWGAVAVGFFGVLVMAVPGVIFFWLPAGAGPVLDLGSALAIGSAFFLAGAIVLVKSLSDLHTPVQLLLWANLLSTLLLTPGLIAFWGPISVPNAGWILLMSVLGVGAQFCFITAMSMGDASFLSPMDYLRLPMAALADFLLFKLLPGMYVWLGAAIIVSATLYITLREAYQRRRARKAAALAESITDERGP